MGMICSSMEAVLLQSLLTFTKVIESQPPDGIMSNAAPILGCSRGRRPTAGNLTQLQRSGDAGRRRALVYSPNRQLVLEVTTHAAQASRRRADAPQTATRRLSSQTCLRSGWQRS